MHFLSLPRHIPLNQKLCGSLPLMDLFDRLKNFFTNADGFWTLAQRCRLISVEAENVFLEFDITEAESNPGGMLNGGCTATLMEIAIAAAYYSMDEKPRENLVSENHVWKIRYTSGIAINETVLLHARIDKGNNSADCSIKSQGEQSRTIATCQQRYSKSSDFNGQLRGTTPKNNDHCYKILETFLDDYCRGKNFWSFVGMKSLPIRADEGNVTVEFKVDKGDTVASSNGKRISDGLVATIVDCITVAALFTSKHRGYGVSKEIIIRSTGTRISVGDIIKIQAQILRLEDREAFVGCWIKKSGSDELLVIGEHLMHLPRDSKIILTHKL